MRQKTIQDYIENFEQKREHFDEETLNKLWNIAIWLENNMRPYENAHADRLYCLNDREIYSGQSFKKSYSIINHDPVIRRLLEVECQIFHDGKIGNEEFSYVSGEGIATGLKKSEGSFIDEQLDSMRKKIVERTMTQAQYHLLLDSSPESIFISLYLQSKMIKE